MTASNPATTAPRYSSAAIILHWLIAAMIFGQIGLGWYFADLEGPAKRALEDIHISLGLTVLLLTLLRVGLAVMVRRPPPPPGLAPLERKAAGAVHILFYVMLLALPLSGWIMESVGTRPIHFWGLVWPHAPGLELLLEGRDRRAFKEMVEQAHGSPMVWAMIGLIALHVLGALKHQFDGAPVLYRMAPFLKAPSAADSAAD